MDDILVKLLPVFIGFMAVFAVKKLGWVDPKVGDWLLKISLYVTIPALIVVSVSHVGFTRELFIFPLLSAIVLAITFVVTRPIYKRLALKRATEGTFRVAPLTINSGFTLPFLLAAFGGEGATRVILFNAGYNPLLLLGVYGIAASYNPKSTGRKDLLRRIMTLPPLWALAIGLLMNIGQVQFPGVIESGLQAVGNLTMFCMVGALGLLFTPRRIKFDTTLAILGLRMGIGLLVGLAVVTVLRIEGIDRAAVLALAAAPIGFNLLTFASVEKLDQDLAASAVSLSILTALFVTPLIILLAT